MALKKEEAVITEVIKMIATRTTNRDEFENFLLANCNDNDLLITMGAGDVYKIGEKLLGK